MMRLRLPQAAIVGCLLATCQIAGPALAQPVSTQGPTTQAKDKATGCSVEMRPDWAELSPRWSGPCPGGNASGLGVLRLYNPAGMRTAYYGEMADGKLGLGVIDAGDGYVAGKFVNGEPEPVEDRGVIIRAFQRASDAAKAMSQSFRQQNNRSSASFYADMAKKLANQMD